VIRKSNLPVIASWIPASPRPGAIANAGNGTGEFVLTGRDYTFNNGVNPSTGDVEIQAYPMYPVITDSAQSIRQYALA
jgi:hypothetical protein